MGMITVVCDLMNPQTLQDNKMLNVCNVDMR